MLLAVALAFLAASTAHAQPAAFPSGSITGSSHSSSTPTSNPPVDCVVSSWSEWSACSVECGGGSQQRTKSILQAASNGGSSCVGPFTETQECNKQLCDTPAPTTAAPTASPTAAPTFAPVTPAPTRAPTNAPTAAPTDSPTAAPTLAPVADVLENQVVVSSSISFSAPTANTEDPDALESNILAAISRSLDVPPELVTILAITIQDGSSPARRLLQGTSSNILVDFVVRVFPNEADTITTKVTDAVSMGTLATALVEEGVVEAAAAGESAAVVALEATPSTRPAVEESDPIEKTVPASAFFAAFLPLLAVGLAAFVCFKKVAGQTSAPPGGKKGSSGGPGYVVEASAHEAGPVNEAVKPPMEVLDGPVSTTRWRKWGKGKKGGLVCCVATLILLGAACAGAAWWVAEVWIDDPVKFNAGDFACTSGCVGDEIHAPWDRVLRAAVTEGSSLNGVTFSSVDYKSIDASPGSDFQNYLDLIASVEPARLTSAGGLALMINAYNALAIKVVLEDPDTGSIWDRNDGIVPVWKRKVGKVAGRSVSLDQTEHEIIRKVWPEPRIHAAVNCASLSCPDLRAGAFTGGDLPEQLDAAMRQWLSNDSKGAKLEGGVLTLSPIFEWYGGDFSRDGMTLFSTLHPFAPPAVQEHLHDVYMGGGGEEWRSFGYDWALNRTP